MPSILAEPVSRPTDPYLLASDHLYLPATQPDTELAGGELKRSQRSRRPSIRKLESDEYQASSRGSSHPPTPVKPNQPPKLKKRQHGKRGDRPGRIVQPNTRTTGNNSSLEPFTTPGPKPGNLFMESQGPTAGGRKTDNRKEAIHRATDFLGVDASSLPPRTLEKVLAAIADQAEGPEATPMDVEGGSAPAVMQSAHEVVLAGGYPPQANAPSGRGNLTSKPMEQLASGHLETRIEIATNIDEDTATESKTKSSIVELGPGDSVSQRLAPAATIPQPTPSAVFIYQPEAPNLPGDMCANTNTATTNGFEMESNDLDTSSDSDSDSLLVSKRPRLAHPAYSQAGEIWPHATAQSKPQPTRGRSAIARDLVLESQPNSLGIPASPIVPIETQVTTSDQAPPPRSLSTLQPPSSSDLDTAIAWVAHMANQGAESASQATQSGYPLNAFGAILKALGDLRSHLGTRATGAISRLGASPSQSTLALGHMDFVEDNAEALDAHSAQVSGKHLPSCRKATLNDFPGLPRRIARLAMPELLATAFTRGPYETFGTLCEWAEEVFEVVWHREAPNEPYQKPLLGLVCIMVHRISWFCSELKTQLRPKIEFEYGFFNPPCSSKELRHNQKLVKKLASNIFYCKGLQADIDAYEHPAVEKCIAVGYFSGPDAIGIHYHEKFRPIPLPAIATILTTMQHCIKEWQTGQHTKLDLNAGRQIKVYDAQLKGLLAYATPAPKCLRDFRLEWFWFGIAHAGTTPNEEPPIQPITRADRVQPDTPVRNPKHQVPEGSRALAKGKRRAKD